MNKVIFYLSLILASFFVTPVYGQSFLEKMAEKAAKKAEAAAQKKAEEEAEKKMDESFEKAEKNISNEESAKAEEEEDLDLNALMGKMGVSSQPAIFEDRYSFQSSITMDLKTFSKDGKLKNEGLIKIYANAGEKSFAYEFVSGELGGNARNEKGIIIMDFINESSIILSNDNGKKTGVVYGGNNFMDNDSWGDDEEIKNNDSFETLNPNLKKTGKTKVIIGYKSEEYLYDDESSKATIWITGEIDWNSKDIMTSMFRSSMYSHGIWGGFLMESESVEKGDGDRNTYKVIDINNSKKKTFSMAEYEITNVGTFQMPQE